MLYYSCVDVLGIAIDSSSLTFHCIFSVFGVRSVMPYYNKMMMMMMMMTYVMLLHYLGITTFVHFGRFLTRKEPVVGC